MEPGTITFRNHLKQTFPMQPGERMAPYLRRLARARRIDPARLTTLYYGHSHYHVTFRDAHERALFFSPPSGDQLQRLAQEREAHSDDLTQIKKEIKHEIMQDVVRKFSAALLELASDQNR